MEPQDAPRYESLVFTRHDLKRHALILEGQAWFCLRNLGRLMGRFFEDRVTRKLGADQCRTVMLRYYGDIKPTLMVNESAAYTLLVYHPHPTNPQLRQWLTQHVLPLMQDTEVPALNNAPVPGVLAWKGRDLSVLHWQSEPWIRLRDMPTLVVGRQELASGWWAKVKRGLRLDC